MTQSSLPPLLLLRAGWIPQVLPTWAQFPCSVTGFVCCFQISGFELEPWHLWVSWLITWWLWGRVKFYFTLCPTSFFLLLEAGQSHWYLDKYSPQRQPINFYSNIVYPAWENQPHWDHAVVWEDLDINGFGVICTQCLEAHETNNQGNTVWITLSGGLRKGHQQHLGRETDVSVSRGQTKVWCPKKRNKSKKSRWKDIVNRVRLT